MPLSFAPINTDLKVIKIVTDEKVKKHLENLGLTISSNIRVLENKGGNAIVSVKNSRLALDRSLANKIYVG